MNLVTGGCGFIGKRLTEKLIAKREKVRIIDIADPYPPLKQGGVEYLNTDIRDSLKVIQACEGVERIYHIASLVPISKAGRIFWKVNVGGTRNILEGALRHKVKKVIHLSSSAVYDINQRNPLNENSPLKPLGIYGRSKYGGEKVCYEYRQKGLDITIVRPRTVIGPGRLGIYQILFDWLRRGKDIYIIGSGDNKIQFVHVDDLVSAMMLMPEKAANETFNIGTDTFNTLREDLFALITYAGTGSRIISLNPYFAIPLLKILDKLNLSPLADWHYLSYHKDFYFDISKARDVLGWKPFYSNARMLTESYQWYLDHLDEAESDIGTTHRKSVKQRLLKILREVS